MHALHSTFEITTIFSSIVDIQPEISGSSFPVKRNADDFGSSQHEKKRRFFYTLI